MALPPVTQPRSATHFSVPCNYQAPDVDLKNIFNAKRPLSESINVHLSTWPAFGAGQTILEKRKPCTAPDLKTQSSERPATSVSKPRFLEQLENYLRRELQGLDLTKENAQELKLQPYREVFEYFIEEFKTYKPLLSSIKNEYEIALARQREQIRSLEPLKSMLVTVSEQCDQKIHALREVEKMEITELRMERFHLLKRIDKVKINKTFLKAQVAKLQKELAKQYFQYRNELDARKVLMGDMNEMKLQQSDLSVSVSQEINNEDPTVLRMALTRVRLDLTTTQVELNKMKTDYGDVVPKRDYELQEKRYSQLLEETATLENDFMKLKNEHELLLEINKQLHQQRDTFCTNLAKIERSSTPRPHWEKCAEVLPGGADAWNTVSMGKKSDELVDVLLSELGWRVLKEKDVFVGRGKDESVPVHLRYEGKIKNLKMNKIDVEKIVREVWREKLVSDQQKEAMSSLPEFFHGYLLKKFSNATTAMEWSYCVHETCRMYRTDLFLHLFYSILMGKVDEAVYRGLVALPSMLLKLLNIEDTEQQGTVNGEQFRQALRTALPLKTERRIQELVETAELQLGVIEDTYKYKELFPEEDEWKSGNFMVLLRMQHLEEKKDYLKDIKNTLWNVKEVTVDALRKAFVDLDPFVNFQIMEGYISQAFRIPKDQFEQAEPLELETILQNLQAVEIRRTSPPRELEPEETSSELLSEPVPEPIEEPPPETVPESTSEPPPETVPESTSEPPPEPVPESNPQPPP